MLLRHLACALAAVLLPQSAHAADWPTRPVTVVVPLGAGGNTDMMARLGAQQPFPQEGPVVKFQSSTQLVV